MKTPPLLLAMALLFWGWQTDQLVFAIPLALILEGSRFLPTRFELSPLEFNRAWNLCLLAFTILIVTIYVSNKGLGSIYVSTPSCLPASRPSAPECTDGLLRAEC